MRDKIIVTIAFAVLAVCLVAQSRALLPPATADSLLWLAAFSVMTISTWRVRTGRIPPLQLGPTRRFQNRMLLAGFGLMTVSIFWLMISYLAGSAWFPDSGYALIFFPFVGLFMIGTMCVIYPAILWFYRLIGLAQFGDEAVCEAAE